MSIDDIKNLLEKKYLDACKDVMTLQMKAKEGKAPPGTAIADTVMSMLAIERKKTVLDIYAKAYPHASLSDLIERGKNILIKAVLDAAFGEPD